MLDDRSVVGSCLRPVCVALRLARALARHFGHRLDRPWPTLAKVGPKAKVNPHVAEICKN